MLLFITDLSMWGCDMKPIKIISPSFDLLGEIDNYESLQFTRRFFGVGEFEIHININKDHTDKLVKNNIIMLGSDVHKVGIIRYREINDDELIIKGPTLDGIIGKRITLPDMITGYDRIAGNAETVMKHFIDSNCINPTDTNRKISQLINATDEYRGVETPWQTRYENLADVIKQIAEWCDIGWEVYLDIASEKWVFDVVVGKNLTADQSLLPPVIFSPEFENVEGTAYMVSALDAKNVGYAGGKGDEEERLVLQVGDAEGLDRDEIFLDCSDSEDSTELTSNGEQKLGEHGQIESFEAKILLNNSFIYGTDWDLGDIVTIRKKKWSLTMNARITEVKEIYESAGFALEVVFGNSIPTLSTKIKKDIKTIVR